ncbi:IS110 family transposase [uncultured Thiodictyon sp.]|jgi:transposase|uniref:IS110 family transposase n=1 Tax=uncultured Thiodictyon sp. TaxID=1846217 RepID=UPI0025D8CDCB|nr:IS110 family transposase [uncultured Thiodictyon sp.]
MKCKPIHVRLKRRKKNRPSKTQQCINTTAQPDAAGIDIGADEIVAAVPPDRDAVSVRTFSSFTGGVHELRDWLLACGVKTVAMESTGNYWVTCFDVLEQAGIEVYLVNARHVKGVPGKKTDVCDAQWLQQLHAAGLLKKSFRPAQDILPLRYLMRHRAGLVSELSRQVLLMQKVLTEMNLKIHHVFSDLDGVSAQAIITAILAGERDPATLAALRDRRCKSSEQTVISALQGDYRPEYLFVLAQCQSQWLYQLKALAELDERIEVLIKGIAPLPNDGDDAAEGAPPPALKKGKPPGKNTLRMDLQTEAARFYGVDLGAIDGVGSGLLGVMMSELGTREQILNAFPTPAQFCSWMGLNPANDISGGKVLKAKTRSVKNRLADAFRLCALGLANAKGLMGQYSRRIKGRLGKAEGITATAHKLARVVYAMIATGRPYDETEAFKITPQNRKKQLNKLEKQAEALGFQIVAIP